MDEFPGHRQPVIPGQQQRLTRGPHDGLLGGRAGGCRWCGWWEGSALSFRYFFLQPLDGPDRAAHTQQALAYCLAHPRCRLSLQMHKVLGIP
jgi:hypothetical protein